MDFKQWHRSVRIINLLSAVNLLSLQTWYLVELFMKGGIGQILTRIAVPVFLCLFAVLLVAAEFKLTFTMEEFKFLNSVVGLAIFNLFLASVISLEFSTLHPSFGVAFSSVYLFFGLCFLALSCLKPEQQEEEPQEKPSSDKL